MWILRLVRNFALLAVLALAAHAAAGADQKPSLTCGAYCRGSGACPKGCPCVKCIGIIRACGGCFGPP
jgi:hypothetical protein